jgi:hypothetical protein
VVSYRLTVEKKKKTAYFCMPAFLSSVGKNPRKRASAIVFEVVTLVVVSWLQVERHIKVVYLCAVVNWWWAETPETSIRGSFSLVS